MTFCGSSPRQPPSVWLRVKGTPLVISFLCSVSHFAGHYCLYDGPLPGCIFPVAAVPFGQVAQGHLEAVQSSRRQQAVCLRINDHVAVAVVFFHSGGPVLFFFFFPFLCSFLLQSFFFF